MTGETKVSISGWTIDTYAAHNEALRVAEERYQTERDRRYTEVGVEREKALKIKETADLAALGLAREIQTYKDEKANELREQINAERGLYASKSDLEAAVQKIEETLKPIQEFVSAQRGRSGGTDNVWKYVFLVIAAVVGVATVFQFNGRVAAPASIQFAIPPGYTLTPIVPQPVPK
jgi:hypothetical protein